MVDLNIENEPENEPRKVLGLAAVILVALAAAGALYYFVFVKKPAAPPAPETPPTEVVLPEGSETTPAEGAVAPLAFPPVALGESDPAIREQVRRGRRQHRQRAEPETPR
jgi:hypothetical protein